MTASKSPKWNSLGDFLQAKEERERNEAAQIGTPVLTPVETPVSTPVDTPVPTPVAKEQSLPRERTAYLDATHTASEKSVYSVMYRETVTRGVADRHFGFKELSQKTGIRSDKTMRVAIDGLIEKLSIEIIAYQHGSPLGPRFRVFDPKEIARRRKIAGIEIDPQSRKIIRTPVGTGVSTGVSTGGKSDGRTPVDNTPVTPVDSTGVYINGFNPLNINPESDDDEPAARALLAPIQRAIKAMTGRELSEGDEQGLRELGEIIAMEFQIAAARTTVNVPGAFLATHMRRRLFKKEKAQMVEEAGAGDMGTPGIQGLTNEEISRCPDCGGSGWFYPEGTEKGVRKCKHERLMKAE
jgi:hypothetical protein